MKKSKKLFSAEELLNEKYGKPGTDSREIFQKEAFAFYFGEVIRERRKSLKMTQEELANIVGKKRPYISRIEKGEDIKLSNFSLLIKALKLSIELKPA